jgi:hypothetical protein
VIFGPLDCEVCHAHPCTRRNRGNNAAARQNKSE